MIQELYLDLPPKFDVREYDSMHRERYSPTNVKQREVVSSFHCRKDTSYVPGAQVMKLSAIYTRKLYRLYIYPFKTCSKSIPPVLENFYSVHTVLPIHGKSRELLTLSLEMAPCIDTPARSMDLSYQADSSLGSRSVILGLI